MIAHLFADGSVCGLVLAFMAVETAILWRRAAASRGGRLDLLLAMAPGAALTLALAAALAGRGWAVVALCLALALPAHLADMSRRRFWRAAKGE